MKQDTCLQEGHDLFKASYPTMSHDWQYVYVICECGNSRKVKAEDWATIQAARAGMAQTHKAVERR